MTLNQVLKRIRELVTTHKQLRNYYYGVTTDFLNERTTRYPSAFVMDTAGSIQVAGKVRSLGFQIMVLDLVNVSADAKDNEQDVLSDMLSIAEDLVAEFNHSSYADWKVGASVPLTFVKEFFGDMVAGVSFDITVETPYDLDVCAVPTDLPIQTEDMKLVYDEKYVATGSEDNGGKNLVIPAVLGRKILLITRESVVIYKASNLPTSSEYTFDGTTIILGAPSNPGERFLILYRTY